MQPSKTILFFGNERLATGVTTKLPILNELVLNGYDVAAIVLPRRDKKNSKLEVLHFANSHNIPVIYLSETTQAGLASYHAELAVLASFGSIVHQNIIDIFPRGIVNIHPSLLPKHRGPIPIEAVMLAGEHSTGVSIMSLGAAMDAGPLYDQRSIPLSGQETKQELADTLDHLGAERLLDILPAIIAGSLQPKPQNNSQATYDKRLSSKSGIIDANLPADSLESQIRAYAGWPRSRLTLNHLQLIITSAHVEKNNNLKPGAIRMTKTSICLGTAHDMLCIDRLIPAGSKEMTIAEFIRGYGKLLNP